METTPIRKRETELNPRRGSARLRANRFAPLQTVDRPKPGKFTRSRRPAGRVRAHARPSFALLDRAFPGPRTKREGRALLTENWQHWDWQQFHIGNIGRVLPVCECCQSPGPIANAPYRPAALRGRPPPKYGRTSTPSTQPTPPTPSSLPDPSEGTRRKSRLCRLGRLGRLCRPSALRGGPPPQSGRTSPRFLVVPSARRPVVLAKRGTLSSRGVRGVLFSREVRGVRRGAAAEPFREGRRSRRP